MARVRNGVGVPEEVRLLHHEAGSRRVDESHSSDEIDFIGEPGADAHLFEGRDNQRGCSGLVEGREDGDDEVGQFLPRLCRRPPVLVPRSNLIRHSTVDVVEVDHVA